MVAEFVSTDQDRSLFLCHPTVAMTTILPLTELMRYTSIPSHKTSKRPESAHRTNSSL